MAFFDFLRPQWKHSDPVKRSIAVQNLDASQQEILASIALADPVVEVRRIAARKVSVLETLRRLMRDSDPEIRQIARAKAQEEFARILRQAEGDHVDQEMIRELEGSPLLDDLLRNARSASVRLALVGVTGKMSVLAQVAMRDADERVARAALDKLDRESMIQEVADHSRHPSVRQAALARLKPKHAEETVSDEEQLLQQKRAAVMAHAQRLAERRDILPLREEFAQVVREAEILGMGDLQTAFDTLVTQFESRVRAELERRAAEEAAAKAKAEWRENLRAVLAEMESVAGSGAAIGREGEVRHLQARWAELNGDSDSELAPRFRAALSAFLRQIEELQAARQDEMRRHELRQKILQQMREISSSQDADFVERQLKALVREWESMPSLSTEDPLQLEFQASRDALNALVYQRSEERRQIYEDKVSRLRSLIERVQNLDENQDFREISKILRQTYLEWKEIVGENKYQFQEMWKEYRAATARFEEMKDWEMWRNEQEREQIIQQVESLLELDDPAEVLARLRHQQQAWKEAGFVPQPRLQELWERYKSLVEKVQEKCRSYIEEQNASRRQNLETKQALCAQVEALCADVSDNWKEKLRQMQSIQEQWKQVGPVPREEYQALWERFRKATDEFYAAHKAYMSKEDGERKVNLEKKLALCEQAEALRESTDWVGTTNRLRKLQEQWKAVGPVPKADSEAVWTRFREACDAFFERKRAYFEGLEAEKDANLKKKIALCEKLESMNLDPSDPEVVRQVEAIEAEWKNIGMVPKDQVDALWARFCQSADRFLEARAALDAELAAELDLRRKTKEAMIDRIRELCDDAGSNQAAEAVRQLQEEWKQLGRSGAGEQELYRRFREACDEFFEVRRDQMEIQEQARQNNLHRKYLLIEQVERLLNSGDLHEGALDEVRHLRRLWKEVGPVPREHTEKIWQRFNSACDAVFAAVRGEKTR